MSCPSQRQILCFLLFSILVFKGCDRGRHEEKPVTIVFRHGKIIGDPEAFDRLIQRFEVENTGIKVKDEMLPSATDEQHQLYVINLEGRSTDFDVFAMDVIWVPEFARAGWLRDLSHILPPEERGEFFKGPVEAVTFNGRIYAIPWYIDAGVLFYRKDLLEKYGFLPPKTWHELVHIASEIARKEPDLYGFVWQGKQYEGLVCNVLEYLWGNGGGVFKDGRIVIDSLENQQALGFMRDLIYEYSVTPEFVTTMTEEPSRRIFGKGKAIFMRNWPYAWNIFQGKDSPVKGKVGVSSLPSFPGHESFSTLGGWQLGINRYTRHPEEAERFIQFFTSNETQKGLSLTIGYQPTRRRLYSDADLVQVQPFMASLYGVFEHARPRPVTPFYMMLSQVIQPEFSAVLSRIKGPEEALTSARKQIEFVLRVED